MVAFMDILSVLYRFVYSQEENIVRLVIIMPVLIISGSLKAIKLGLSIRVGNIKNTYKKSP